MPEGSKRSDMCEAAGWSAGSAGSLVTLHRKLCSISCAACAAHWAARPDGGANGTLPDDGSRAEFARSIGEFARARALVDADAQNSCLSQPVSSFEQPVRAFYSPTHT